MQTYFQALKQNGYSGEAHDREDIRLINATDNSIYQFMPQAVLYPKTTQDLDIIFQTANQDEFRNLKFAPRGGGTGTNGQSLNNVITVDTSKHLNKILEIDFEKGIARVQPGVVLSVLNRHLAKKDFFFPAHVSTANRATLGGMVSTDACGKGSIIYGKTGNHVLKINGVLANGQAIEVHPDSECPFGGAIKVALKTNREMIVEKTPDLPRHFTGYNLKGAYVPEQDHLNLPLLIAGSEGSLLTIKELTLNILPRPKHKALFAVSYDDFIGALEIVPDILAFKPGAVETIDNHVLRLAKTDNIWHQVTRILPDGINSEDVKAMHCIEFIADTADDLASRVEAFSAWLKQQKKPFYLTHDDDEIAAVWEMRNLCVGLLGNMDGPKRPWPFVEDGAVPPENLAGFVKDVREFLATLNIDLGLFGHADAGCLHIRPILDLRNQRDAGLIRKITDGMVEIVARHHGNFWGEHGRGLRGEFITDIMGPEFYGVMQEIKALFDPDNRLNPGKMATAKGTDLPLYKIDQIPLRGYYDRQIDEDLVETYPKAIQCNGNGVCFSAMPDDTMCPSYKATRDRRHSPKGRAGLLREWMRRQSHNEGDTIADDVLQALHGCLGCKACTSTCPIHVNIPDMRADFYQTYYQSNRRPWRDYAVAEAEKLAEVATKYPRTMHLLMNNPISGFAARKIFGLTDLPRPSVPGLSTLMKHNGIKYADLANYQPQEKSVLIVQDAFTSAYNADAVIDVMRLLQKFGFEPAVIPLRETGKSRHVKGFLKAFKNLARQNTEHFQLWAKTGVPMVGIDPSLTLVYRDEYPKALNKSPGFQVHLPQEFLSDYLFSSDNPDLQVQGNDNPAPVDRFLHCTEKTALPTSAKMWQTVFQICGVKMRMAQTGCCGMAGTYGHEVEHLNNSRKLFDLSWKKPNEKSVCSAATGFSCREQTARFGVNNTRHPASVLLSLIDKT